MTLWGSFTLTHLLYLVSAIGWTLVLSALAFVLGSVAGFGVMLARISPRAWLRWLAMGYIECIQGIPLLILLFYAVGLGLRGPITQVTLFEAAMAPQIGGAIVAIQYGLNAPLISLMVGVGTVLSFVTLPLWWKAFQALGLG